MNLTVTSHKIFNLLGLVFLSRTNLSLSSFSASKTGFICNENLDWLH